MCHPVLVSHFLDAFDEANEVPGALRNPSKTEVIYYATQEVLDSHSAEWRLGVVRLKAAVSLASEGADTLGVATGPASFVAEQLYRKTKVVKAIHERLQLCQDPQTEFVLARESLGVGRVNHILRVHGHALAERGGAATAFYALGRSTLERMFPGVTSEGLEQASFNAKESGLGWRCALDVARPAH